MCYKPLLVSARSADGIRLVQNTAPRDPFCCRQIGRPRVEYQIIEYWPVTGSLLVFKALIDTPNSQVLEFSNCALRHPLFLIHV